MSFNTIVGSILGAVLLITMIVVSIKICQRGLGAKILFSVTTIGVGLLVFHVWHIADGDVVSIVVGLLLAFSIGLGASLLLWVILTSLGIAGDGGFFSELARKESAESNRVARNELPELKIEVGNFIEFGILNNKQAKEINGLPIIWRVLDIRDNKALLLAEQFVGAQPYDYYASNVGATSTRPWIGDNDLRAWLNGDFLKKSFSKVEHLRLALSDTNDYVFCLSADEATHYFTSDAERRFEDLYEHCREQLDELKEKLYNLEDDGSLLGKAESARKKMSLKSKIERINELRGWWLRPTDSMMLQKHVPYVATDGSINRKGAHAASSLYVRPAIWIFIRSDD